MTPGGARWLWRSNHTIVREYVAMSLARMNSAKARSRVDENLIGASRSPCSLVYTKEFPALFAGEIKQGDIER